MFTGSITAMITPFKNGEVDYDRLEAFIEWQIEQGSHGLVPCGTTGESPTLSYDEHKAIIRRCAEVVNRRIPVIAGTGANSTREAIELTEAAKDAGADACLSVVPYYNKPTQDGIFAHFKAIHDTVDLPVILYDIPGRSVIEMTLDTITDLSELPGIVGIKDATNDLSRVCALRERVPSSFSLLSGEDPTVPGFYALGGDGVISVISNAAPALSAKLYESWSAGDLERFTSIRDALAPLSREAFCESSPAPIKYALEQLGHCTDDVRLPLLPASKTARAKIDAALLYANLM